MAIYARGTHSRAICDRCGREIAYLDLKTEWTGYRVCGECLDYKTKQEFPDPVVPDPEAIRDPRPDYDVEAHIGTVRTTLDPIGDAFDTSTIEAKLGDVTVVIT